MNCVKVVSKKYLTRHSLKIVFHFTFFIIMLTVASSVTYNEDDTHRRSYVALILARGGSKGIPKKNLAAIEGSSLLMRTVTTAKTVGVFDDIWVSTDDLDIYKEATLAGAKVYGRSAETSTDQASSLSAVKEFFNFFPNISVLSLLQCTSPFISTVDLRKAYYMIEKLDYDSVFSATRLYSLNWHRTSGNTTFEPLNFRLDHRPRRQDWDGEWAENGMFYWFKTSSLSHNLLQHGRIGIVEVAVERSLEIDTVHQLNYARYLAPKLFPILKNEESVCIDEENK